MRDAFLKRLGGIKSDSINKYQLLSLEITLNINGYDYNDLKELMQEPFLSLYSTKVGYQWHPTIVGEDFIEICLIIGATIGSAIAGGFLSEIGSDLYNWAKSSLRKVLKNKTNFEESRVHITFKDITITVYIDNKEDLIIAMESFERIVNKALKRRKNNEKGIEIEIQDIVKN